MDGQNFDPKFGTQASLIKPAETKPAVANPRDTFIQGLIDKQIKPKSEGWFKKENLIDEQESLAEQTGATEFASGVIRPQLDRPKRASSSEVDIDTPDYQLPANNTWLYGKNLGVTRYASLRSAVGLKPGQSFTEYYKLNKFIPAGFELDAKLLLREEKIKALETQMLDGKMGYDTFLYKAYGKDILKMNGHDFDSTLYWYNRRKNGLFDSVKDNLTYMDSVLRSAESQYIQESWNRESNENLLTEIEGAVLSDQPIKPELMRELFPGLFEALDDEIDSDVKIMDLFLAGQLKEFQPYIDTDGDGKIDYYLHTNGRLYKTAEQSVATGKEAKVFYNGDGTVKEIFLPGAWTADFGTTESFATSVLKTLAGVPDFLGYVVWGLADGLEYVFTGDKQLDKLGDYSIWSMKYQNSQSWLSNDFYVENGSWTDKSGDLEWRNIARGVGEGVGMVAGMIGIAWTGAGITKLGGLAGGVSAAVPAADITIKATKGLIPKVLVGVGGAISKLSAIKNGTPIFTRTLGVTARTLESVGFLAVRDFLTTAGELSARKQIDGITDEDIFARSLEMTAVNAAVSFALRSVDDYGAIDRFKLMFGGSTKAINRSTMQKMVQTGVYKGYQTFFTPATGLINTIADMTENFITMAMNTGVVLAKDDYSPGESFTNFLTGAEALLNSPSAMASQLIQGVQTYRGSINPLNRSAFGQATRDVSMALREVHNVAEQADVALRQRMINGTPTERTSLEVIQKQFNDVRQYEHEFILDKNGDIIGVKAKTDANGKLIPTQDLAASEAMAVLWLHRTFQDKTDAQSKFNLVEKPSTFVDEIMKKAITAKVVEYTLAKFNLVYGAYNSYVRSNRKTFNDLAKKPESFRALMSKGFQIYNRVQNEIGKGASGDALRQRLAQRLQRSSLQQKILIAAADSKLLEDNPDYKKAVENLSSLIEIDALSGTFDLTKLNTAEVIKRINERRAAQGKNQLPANASKEALVKFALTSLTVEELNQLRTAVATDNNLVPENGQGGVVIRLTGSGTDKDLSFKALVRVLDLIASYDAEYRKVDPQAPQMVTKIAEGKYVIFGNTRAYPTVSLVNLIGATFRLTTAMRLAADAGKDAKFVQDALYLYADILSDGNPGDFAKRLTSTDAKVSADAKIELNKLINDLITFGILNFEQAAYAYRQEYATNDPNATGIERYFKTIMMFQDLQNQNAALGGKATPEFIANIQKFTEYFNSSPENVKKAINTYTPIDDKIIRELSALQFGGLGTLKKALGFLGLLKQRAKQNLPGTPNQSSNTSSAVIDLIIQNLGKSFRFATKGTDVETFQRVLTSSMERFTTVGAGTNQSVFFNKLLSLIIDNDDVLTYNLQNFRSIVDRSGNLLFNGLSNEEVDRLYGLFQNFKIQLVQDLNFEHELKINPSLATLTDQEKLTKREELFREYILNQYESLLYINPQISKFDPRTEFDKIVNLLLDIDPQYKMFVRNAGDQSLSIDIKQLMNNFLLFLSSGTLDVQKPSKIYINLNTVMGPAHVRVARFIANAPDESKGAPVHRALGGGEQPEKILQTIGLDSPGKFASEIGKEASFIQMLKQQNPSGILMLEVGSKEYYSFLEGLGINPATSANDLRQFNIFGYAGGPDAPSTIKVLEMTFANGINQLDSVFKFIEEEERKFVEEALKKNPKLFEESFNLRLNARFGNVMFIDDDTVIDPSNIEGLVFSSLKLLTAVNLDEVRNSFRKTTGTESSFVIKFGKLGGLSEAISLASSQLGLANQRDSNLYAFKVLRKVAEAIKIYQSDKDSKKPILNRLTQKDIDAYESTGLWVLSKQPLNEKNNAGENLFLVNFNLAKFTDPFEVLVNYAKKGVINLNLIFPELKLSEVDNERTSPTIGGVVIPGRAETAGTGLSPFSAFYRVFGSISELEFNTLFNPNGIALDLTNFDLSKDSLNEIKNMPKSVKDVIALINTTRNPFIKMIAIGLSNSKALSELVLNELAGDSRLGLSVNAVKLLLNPSARLQIAQVLRSRLTDLETRTQINKIINSDTFVLSNVRRTGVSALPQAYLKDNEDFINQSVIGTYNPTNKKIPYEFTEAEIRTLRNLVEDNLFISPEENEVIDNPFTNIKTLIGYSNDTNNALYNPKGAVPAMRIDLEGMFNLTESELIALENIINSLKFFSGASVKMFAEKLAYVRSVLPPRPTGPTSERVGVPLAPAAVTDKMVFSEVEETDTGTRLKETADDPKIRTVLEMMKNKRPSTIERANRHRLNTMFNNPKFAREKDFLNRLESDLGRLGENSTVGSRLILNLRRNDLLGRYISNQSAVATHIHDNLLNDFKGSKQEKLDAAVRIAETMMVLTDGADFVSQLSRFLIIDPETGKIVNTAALINSDNDPKYLNDFLVAISQDLNKPKPNLLVIELNKNMMTGAGSLSNEKFSYFNINESNKNEFVSILVNLVEEQYKNEKDFKPNAEFSEKFISVFSRSLTRKFYEKAIIDTWNKISENPQFKKFGGALLGQMIDFTYNNDGTYSTLEMFENRELQYEVLDYNEFEKRLNARDAKIQNLLTFFVDAKLLDSDIVNLLGDVRNSIRGLYFQGIYETKDNIAQAKEALKQNKKDVRQAINTFKNQKKSIVSRFELEIEKLSKKIFETVKVIRSKEEFNNEYKIKRNYIEEQLTPYFEADLEFEKKNKEILSSAWYQKIINKFPILKENLTKYDYVSSKIFFSTLFSVRKNIDEQLATKAGNTATNRNLRRELSQIINDYHSFLKTFEPIRYNKKIALAEAAQKKVSAEMEKLRAERKEFFTAVSSKDSSFEERQRLIDEKEKELKDLESALSRELSSLNEEKTLFTSMLESYKAQLEVFGFRETLISNIIKNQDRNISFDSLLVLAEALYGINTPEYDLFLKETFDEIALRYITESENAEAVSLILRKFLDPQALIKLFEQKSKPSFSEKYTDLFKTENIVTFDIESLFANKGRTSPFVLTVTKFKKLNDQQIKTFTDVTQRSGLKNNQKAFDDIIESSFEIFIPSYYYDSLKGKYFLVRNVDDVNKHYSDFISRYGQTEAIKQLSSYFKFIKENPQLRDGLTESELKSYMDGYVDKELQRLNVLNGNETILGYNSSKYDIPVLKGEGFNVGYSLIGSSSLLAQNNIDILNDVRRKLSNSNLGDEDNLDFHRKAFGYSESEGHDSNADSRFLFWFALNQFTDLININAGQTKLISVLNDFKIRLGVKGLKLDLQDINNLDSQLDNAIKPLNINDKLSKDSLEFLKIYSDLFKNDEPFFASIQKGLQTDLEALFRYQTWAKNWSVLDQVRNSVDKETSQFISKVNNKNYRRNVGFAFDYVIKFIYNTLKEPTSSAKTIKEIFETTVRVGKETTTVRDIFYRAFRSVLKKDDSLDASSIMRKGMEYLSYETNEELELKPKQILQAFLDIFQNSSYFLNVKIDSEEIKRILLDFDTYLANQQKLPDAVSEFTKYATNEIDTNSVAKTADIEVGLSSFYNAIEPLVRSLGNIENDELRNKLLKEFTTIIAYDFDDPRLEQSTFNFGKKSVLTNIDKGALAVLLEKLSPSTRSYASLMSQAQSLSVLDTVPVFDVGTNNFVAEKPSNDSFYMSIDNFVELFGLPKSFVNNPKIAIETVRKHLALQPNEDLYVSILRQPSDKANTLHNYKIKIIDKVSTGITGTLTTTSLKSNHSGDVDGDKIFIFKPSWTLTKLANKVTPYQRAALNLIGSAISKVVSSGNKPPVISQTNLLVVEKLSKNFKDRIPQDYEDIINGKRTYESVKNEVLEYIKRNVEEFKNLDINDKGSKLYQEAEDILKYSWLVENNIAGLGEYETGRTNIYTTQNQYLGKEDWSVRNENTLSIVKLLNKKIFGQIDSVTGLYAYSATKRSNFIGNKKMAGFGELFDATGVHLSKADLSYIKTYSDDIINELINKISSDTLLEGVKMPGTSLSARDYLTKYLIGLKDNKAIIGNIEQSIESFLEVYDLVVRSSDQYEKDLLEAIDNAQSSIEIKNLAAAEKQQFDALESILFSMGKVGQEGSFIKSLPDLLRAVFNDGYINEEIRFANPSVKYAQKFLLNALAGFNNNSVLIKNTIGDDMTDYSNYKQARIIYSFKSIPNLFANEDSMYILPSASKLSTTTIRVITLEEGEKFSIDVNKLKLNNVIEVGDEGLKIKDGVILPAGSNITFLSSYKTHPNYLNDSRDAGKQFIIIGVLRGINDVSTMNKTKLTVTGSAKNKSTLVRAPGQFEAEFVTLPDGSVEMRYNQSLEQDFKDAGLNHKAFIGYINDPKNPVQFFRYLDDSFKKANTFAALKREGFIFYDKDMIEINFNDLETRKNDVVYAVESTPLSVAEYTVEWTSDRLKERYFDEGTIINNAFNPEAILWSGSLGRAIKVKKENGVIKAEIDSDELIDLQSHLSQINIGGVEENNGLRLAHILMAKSLIYSSNHNLSQTERDKLFNYFIHRKDLNSIQGLKGVDELFTFLFKEESDKEAWKKERDSSLILSRLFNRSWIYRAFNYVPTNLRIKKDIEGVGSKNNAVADSINKNLLGADIGVETLQTSEHNYDAFKRLGKNVYVDGYGFIGIVELLNYLNGNKKDRTIFKNTINNLASVLNARNKLGNPFNTGFGPVLKSDGYLNNPDTLQGGQTNVKLGNQVVAPLVQLNRDVLAGPMISTRETIDERIYGDDDFSDMSSENRVQEFFTWNKLTKSFDDNKSKFYSDYSSKVLESLLTRTLKNASNNEEKISQFSGQFERFALQYDIKGFQNEDGVTKISFNRVKRAGKIEDLRKTLGETLGSYHHFRAVEKKKEYLNRYKQIYDGIIATKLNIDALEALKSAKQKPEYLDAFQQFIERRVIFDKNKEKTRAEMVAQFKDYLNDDTFKTYIGGDMSRNWFATRESFTATSDKNPINQPQTVGFGVSNKHRFFIEKDLEANDVIKLDPLKLTSSGVSEDDARSFEVSQIVTTLKKEPTAIRGIFMARLENLKSLIFKFGVEKEFTTYSWKKGHIAEIVYLRQQINQETDDAKKGIMESRLQNIFTSLNVKNEFELEEQIKLFEKIYGEVAVEFNNIVTDAYNAQNMVTRESDEPVPDLYWLILPTLKAGTEREQFYLAKNYLLNPRERSLTSGGHVPFAAYDFFRSFETTMTMVSKHIAYENFSKRAAAKGVLANVPVVNFLRNKMYEFLSQPSVKEKIKDFDSKPYEKTTFNVFQETIRNTLVSGNTDYSNIYIPITNRGSFNVVEGYLLLKNKIDEVIGKDGRSQSQLSAVMKLETPDSIGYNKAKDLYNLHEFSNDILAKVNNLLGGDSLSEYLFNALSEYASSKGYALADRYGRKISDNLNDVRPLTEVSMEWVSSVLSNSITQLGGFKKNTVTKAFAGDIYVIDKKLQDHLMKYFFTTKAPAKLTSFIRKVQSIATALIMSNPFKTLDRVLKYTLSDLTFMTAANPKTMFKLNDARKMLSAYIQSKGAILDPQLKQYLNTQGVNLNKTNFDYVLNDIDDYDKKGNIFSQYFESLGKPFEFQTQLVRLAYWLQTVQDLNANKKIVYGSAYYKKGFIDKMESLKDNKGNELASANEVKAAYLMAQQLGAPGDFPLLAKDLNGIFMFTTFPLALVRWAKGEAFSLATAAKNLFVEGERLPALGWLAVSGGGIAASALMVQLIISLIANIYNVDEETEKEWNDKQALPDVFATLIQGAPVMDVYNTADPIKLLSEMTYAPFLEAEAERKEDALYGPSSDGNLTRGNGILKWLTQNIWGKVNPLFRDPIETLMDVSSLGDSVYLQDGPGYENFTRKMSAYIFGSSGSRALGRYIENLPFENGDTAELFFKGLTTVIYAELGNTRKYKADVKNWYKALSLLKQFNYSNNVLNPNSFSSTNFDENRYSSLKTELRKLFNEKADFSKVYVILTNFLENGGTYQEVRSAFNNTTIIGQLSKVDDLGSFLDTLDDADQEIIERAIVYEEQNFPWINPIRESVRQNIESSYKPKYVPRYYQQNRMGYGDTKNIFYKPYRSRYIQDPFKAYRSMWYTVNDIKSEMEGKNE